MSMEGIADKYVLVPLRELDGQLCRTRNFSIFSVGKLPTIAYFCLCAFAHGGKIGEIDDFPQYISCPTMQSGQERFESHKATRASVLLRAHYRGLITARCLKVRGEVYGMAFYHVLALRSRNKTKLIYNKTEAQVLTEFVIPYLETGTIQTTWGKKSQTVPVAELEVYRTDERYDKKQGIPFEKFKRNRKNLYPKLAEQTQKGLSKKKTRVFVIMPIQGEEEGTADEQRVYNEYEARFETINEVLNDLDCFGIRIDKEYPLDELVRRIKDEIEKAQFLIADLTDERPSCYFEAGYGEAKGKHIIYTPTY